jgi:hypothetical protein
VSQGGIPINLVRMAESLGPCSYPLHRPCAAATVPLGLELLRPVVERTKDRTPTWPARDFVNEPGRCKGCRSSRMFVTANESGSIVDDDASVRKSLSSLVRSATGRSCMLLRMTSYRGRRGMSRRA